jgi:hypothetical protein
VTDEWGFPSTGSSSSNVASGFSHVDVQAGTVLGDVNHYTLPPGAGPEEKFDVGVHYLDGGMAGEARALMGDAAMGPARTNRMLFYWLLALVSGRSRDELSADEARHLRDLQADPPEPARGRDVWVDGVRVILLLLDSARRTDADITVALQELDCLSDLQQGLILRHMEQFLEGPLEDKMWELALAQARGGQLAAARPDRVWKFFEPPPIEPRARPPRPLVDPPGSHVRATASAVLLVACALTLAVRLAFAGHILPLLGCMALSVIGLLGLRDGTEWHLEYVGADAELPPGEFARKVDHDFNHYVARYPPRGLSAEDWLQRTVDTRQSIRNEIVDLYRPSRISIRRVAWLLRHEADHIKRVWTSETRAPYTRELRAVPRLGARGQGGLAALLGGGAWLLFAVAEVDILLALVTGFIVYRGGAVHVRTRLAMERERRRFKAEQDQYDEVLAARSEAFDRWQAKLADRPRDPEMARWLDCDRKLLLERALRHYRLAASEVIAHAFIETPAASTQRTRVRRGPWRYEKYRISVFLLTADGVRNFVSNLDFVTGRFDDQGRLNYRFDAVASLRVHRGADNVQKFELVLMNGQSIQMQMADSVLDELPADETRESVARITQDAAGIQHTIHVLEGIAAEGREWVRRTGPGRSNGAGNLASAMRDNGDQQREDHRSGSEL